MKRITILCLIIMTLATIGVTAASADGSLPVIEGFKSESVARAAKNIVGSVLGSPIGKVAVICSKDKENFAAWIVNELESLDIQHTLYKLADTSTTNLDRIKSVVKADNGRQGFIYLIHMSDMAFFVDTIGMPDQGLKISTDYFFSDFLMNIPSQIRLHDADLDELEKFRAFLKSRIAGAKKIRVTTDKGTDITVSSRTWIVSDGETFTAPVENETNGTVFVDASAYNGQPKIPFLLKIKDGRVVNLDELDTSDRQQGMVIKDMSRDDNANVLAELGIGTSINSLWNADMMEAERARGTCHFGFGMNMNFEGGQNDSSFHFDLVVNKPTIIVDGVMICEKGEYIQ